MQVVYTPEFDPSDPNGNMAQLVALYQVTEQSPVPVKSFGLLADGCTGDFTVTPGHFDQTALILFHLMHIFGTQENFVLTPAMHEILQKYFGISLSSHITGEHPEYRALRMFFGYSVFVRLSLQPNYQKRLAIGRTTEELVRHGWEMRDQLQGVRSPLVQRALASFMTDLESRTIEPINDGDPDVWPSWKWVQQAAQLSDLIAT